VQTLLRQLFSSYMYVVKAAKTTFVRKICTFNVDEIDTIRGTPISLLYVKKTHKRDGTFYILFLLPWTVVQFDFFLQISYDFSQRLVKTTHNVELSDNPWICSCSSQITDLVSHFFDFLNAVKMQNSNTQSWVFIKVINYFVL